MEHKKELLDLLNAYIDHIIKNYKKNNPLGLNEDLCLKLKKKVNMINSDSKELVQLNLSEINELFPSFGDWEMVSLDYYQMHLLLNLIKQESAVSPQLLLRQLRYKLLSGLLFLPPRRSVPRHYLCSGSSSCPQELCHIQEAGHNTRPCCNSKTEAGSFLQWIC